MPRKPTHEQIRGVVIQGLETIWAKPEPPTETSDLDTLFSEVEAQDEVNGEPNPRLEVLLSNWKRPDRLGDFALFKEDLVNDQFETVGDLIATIEQSFPPEA